VCVAAFCESCPLSGAIKLLLFEFWQSMVDDDDDDDDGGEI
jgi:hypothetical protein